ncbi:methylation-associated defense system protein MAD7 [Methanosphaerula subterraneus]|uniref:methylation-associated defense system protein MAD7 n=1 Tax=Methanosphaerula subterraneus TaxID=3350244 RepID=UPI003F85259C
MTLKKKDKEFQLKAISYLNFKQIEMDRVLTLLFPLLEYQGYGDTRPSRRGEVTTKEFVATICENEKEFTGFKEHEDITRCWVETDLLDMIHRGKDNSAVAAPRPLHGSTYKYRNPKKCRDYDASRQIYAMLQNARLGASALKSLKDFFFEGLDSHINSQDKQIPLDVETQAILHLVGLNPIKKTQANLKSDPYCKPLCLGAANILAEDIVRLLVYRDSIPRSVMVEYIKTLIAFHLSLYHIRLLSLIPRYISDPNTQIRACNPSTCQYCGNGGVPKDCPVWPGLLVDMTKEKNSTMSRLAETSAVYHYQLIPGFIKAYYTIKKLNEFREDLEKTDSIPKLNGQVNPINGLIELLGSTWSPQREIFFKIRLGNLAESDEQGREDVDPIIDRIRALELDPLEGYIECLVGIRGHSQRRYVIDALDSLMLKNRPGALLSQTRTRNAPRRFILDSRLLEVLLQIAVLEPTSLTTRPILIDDLLSLLENRYGLYIRDLPPHAGFHEPTIEDRSALRENIRAFKERLQEIGFYRELSDASITQIVTPRYTKSSTIRGVE